MANSVSYIYEILDRYSAPLRKISNNTKKFKAASARAARNAQSLSSRMNQMAVKARHLARKLKNVGKATRELGKKFRDFGTGALTRVTAPIVLLGGFALTAFGKIEQLTISFKSMLGGADAAHAMVKRLTDFAARTPFQLEGIGKSAKQLLAFGVLQKNIIPVLTNLGDIAAGANVPLNEMAAIYGKVKAKGKAMTEELLQLSDRGIPIIDVLAKSLRRSKGQIFKMASQGRISFKVLERAMQSMTAKGGLFFNQMAEQSQTLFGKLSTLKDNIFLLFADVGEFIEKSFNVKGNIDSLINQIAKLREAFGEFAKENPVIAQFVGILVILAAALGPAALAIGIMIPVLGLMATGLGVVASAVGLLATALGVLFSPIGLVIAAVVALVAAGYYVWKNWDKIKDLLLQAWSKVADFFSDLWVDIKSSFTEFFSDLWGDIKSLFNGDLFNVGLELIGGLWDGMKTKWAKIVDWLSSSVKSLVNLMPDWVKDRLGLGGPGANGAAGVDGAAGMRGATGLDGFQSAGSSIGMDSSKAVAANANSQRLDINGNIRVSASPGSKVDSTDIGLNGGANLAHGR